MMVVLLWEIIMQGKNFEEAKDMDCLIMILKVKEVEVEESR
jgi:hypothetical protein